MPTPAPADTHGPDTDCTACHECPTCDGVGWSQYGPEILIHQNGRTLIGCADCLGEGVACPNYDPEKTRAA